MWMQCKKNRCWEIVALFAIAVPGAVFLGYGGWLISTLESAGDAAQDVWEDVKSGDAWDKAEDAYNSAVDKVKDLMGDDGNVAGNLTSLYQFEYENVPATFYEISAYDIDGDFVSMNQYSEKLLLIVNVASC